MRQPSIVAKFFLFLLLLSSFLLPALIGQAAHAQGVTGSEPAIIVQITYSFEGIAGPEGADPDFWDELPIPAFLVGDDNLIKYTSFTKINVGDSGDAPDDTAFAKFIEVESGTYRACLSLAAPAQVADFHCTAPFTYEAGTTIQQSLPSGDDL